MKKTRKKNVVARRLSGWAMHLANYLRNELWWSPSRATTQGWLCLHTLEALGKGEVMLDFNKADGSRRIARGTLCSGISEAFDNYEYKKKGGVKKDKDGVFTFCYWDLDEEGFRSFRAERLNDFLVVTQIATPHFDLQSKKSQK